MILDIGKFGRWIGKQLLVFAIGFPLGVSIIYFVQWLQPDSERAFHWMTFAWTLTMVERFPWRKP